MITGKMSDFNRYYSIDPAFEAAHKFYEEYKTQPKEIGEYVLIPDKLKAIVSLNELGDACTKNFEAHRAYADIQVVVKGAERIDWADLDTCGAVVSEEFSKGGDIAFYEDPEFPSAVTLYEDCFMIMFPEDAHKPCVKPCENAQPSTKIIFKVKL